MGLLFADKTGNIAVINISACLTGTSYIKKEKTPRESRELQSQIKRKKSSLIMLMWSNTGFSYVLLIFSRTVAPLRALHTGCVNFKLLTGRECFHHNVKLTLPKMDPFIFWIRVYYPQIFSTAMKQITAVVRNRRYTTTTPTTIPDTLVISQHRALRVKRDANEKQRAQRSAGLVRLCKSALNSSTDIIKYVLKQPWWTFCDETLPP